MGEKSSSTRIREGNIEEVLALLEEVPDFTTRPTIEEVQERISDRPHLILVAEQDGKAAGFKLGYQLEESVLYSWLGAVHPSARRQGIAKTLLEAQETWAKQGRYREIRVKSMNRYPMMLAMLVTNRYQITGTEGDGEELKVHFSKQLDSCTP